VSTVTLAPIDTIAAVGLAELVDQGELMSRVDRKYVVARDDLTGLLTGLPAGTRVLEIDGRREFGYRSTYLDTPDHHSFLSSGRSHRGRWKVRGRVYLDSGASFLETKTVGPRGRTVKQRILHADLHENGLSIEGAAFVAGVIGAGHTRALRPVLETAYRRTTLLLPHGAARVTVDVDLGWTSLASGRDLDRHRLAIVETKTGSTPSSFDRQLWAAGHRPARISKYGAGMAALDPDLPRLKWHRAIARHLELTPTTRSHP
jgi:hypothetical protein